MSSVIGVDGRDEMRVHDSGSDAIRRIFSARACVADNMVAEPASKAAPSARARQNATSPPATLGAIVCFDI